MRIAYVTETWLPSVDGVVTRLEATLAELHHQGHETLVVAPAGDGRSHAGGGVVEMPTFGVGFVAGGKRWGLPLMARVEASVADFGPDLVHVLNPFVLGLAGVRAAGRLGLPLVASFHQDVAAVAGHYHLGLLHRPIWAYVRRVHGHAVLNLATSQAMMAELAVQGIERLALWPYGVDLGRFHPRRRSPEARRALRGATADGVVALYVGRLAVEKDLDRLRPLAGAPGISLVVVGDGPMRTVLEAELAAANVRFTGWLAGDELADAYAGADVFVFPSTTETLGLVVVEALASGLPVVAAHSPPSAEILGTEGAGVLVAADAWDDLAAIVGDAGRPGTGWERRSAAARRRAQGWGWGPATAALVERYEAVLSQTATYHSRLRQHVV